MARATGSWPGNRALPWASGDKFQTAAEAARGASREWRHFVIVRKSDHFDPLPEPSDLVAHLRRNFRQFNATATPADARLLEQLIIAQGALILGLSMPRECWPPRLRRKLERSTDEMEQAFTKLRETVRACPTFATLSVTERQQIEREVFAVRVCV